MGEYIRKLTVSEVAGIPFFSDLNQHNLEVIATILDLYAFDQDVYIFRENDQQSAMYFMLEGSVKILKNTNLGNQETLSELDSPEVFGEMALVNAGKRSASVLTTGQLKVAELSHSNFEKLIQIEPEIAVNIVRKIADTISLRLKKLNSTYVDLVYHG